MLVFNILAYICTLYRTDNIIWTHIKEFLDFALHVLFRYTFSFIFLLQLITYCWKLNSLSSRAAGNFWFLTLQMPLWTCEAIIWVFPSFKMLTIGSEMFGYIFSNSQWLLLHNLLLCLEAEEFLLTLITRCLLSRETWKCKWKKYIWSQNSFCIKHHRGPVFSEIHSEEHETGQVLTFFEFNKEIFINNTWIYYLSIRYKQCRYA